MSINQPKYKYRIARFLRVIKCAKMWGSYADIQQQKNDFIKKNNIIVLKEERKKQKDGGDHYMIMFYVYNTQFNRWLGFNVKKKNHAPVYGHDLKVVK